MDETTSEGPTTGATDLNRRDGEALSIMGGFFGILSVAVLIGTIWSEAVKDRIVNVAAGVVLLGVGCICLAIGRRLRRRSRGVVSSEES